MANRRMFSNRIANSAKFLQMPSESQLLYFHMVLRADDDGVVESYPIIKLLGVGTDNFKVLQAKNFIKQLNDDQVVVITDWTEHNLIRADRKVNSVYFDLLKNTAPEVKTLEPKPRSDVKDNTNRVGGQSTDGIGKVRVGKDKISKDTKTSDVPSQDIVAIIDSFKTVNQSYGKWFKNTTQRLAIERMLVTHGLERLLQVIAILPKSNVMPYIPTITTPSQLEDKWAALEAGLTKKKLELQAKSPKVAFS